MALVIAQDFAKTIPALLDRAASALVSAKTSAEVLEARDVARTTYDAAKTAGRLAKAKQAHDTLLAEVYRAQADALTIEAQAKMRLAEEYTAAQHRGEVGQSGARTDLVPHGNEVVPKASDLGLSRKEIYEARQIRDAEAAYPGIVQRALNARLAQGLEPTRASLREAVTEAAMRGLRGAPSPSNKNPLYRAPTKAGAAWSHLYGTCRALAEWATDENQSLAIDGKSERSDDQAANINAIRRAADFLNDFLVWCK